MLINNEKDFLFSSDNVVLRIKSFLQGKGLSKRESEVVILVVQGLTNKQVADQLCVAEKTVKFHLTNVYKRMKINRRSQIIWMLPMAQFVESTQPAQPPVSHQASGSAGQARSMASSIGGTGVTIKNRAKSVTSTQEEDDMDGYATIPVGSSIVG